MKAPFGPSELEEFRIDVPAANLRSHHPQDTQAVPDAQFAWGTSSAGEHMHIHTLGWVDARGARIERSSQWGAQFDKPRHYKQGGSTELDTGLSSGPAIVLDVRAALAQHSDGLAITKGVINPALEALFKAADPQEKAEFFRRLLLRSLTDELAGSTAALPQFPHFKDQEAVYALIDGIKSRTGKDVQVLFHEPASVDEANQGHLADEDPASHEGGAHGALHNRGVLIGENWDLRDLTNGTIGRTIVHFDPNLACSPDSALVAGAYFVPELRREEFIAKLFRNRSFD